MKFVIKSILKDEIDNSDIIGYFVSITKENGIFKITSPNTNLFSMADIEPALFDSKIEAKNMIKTINAKVPENHYKFIVEPYDSANLL